MAQGLQAVRIDKVRRDLQLLVNNRPPLEWPDTIIERYAMRNGIKVDWTWLGGKVQVIALSKEE
jgi:hypothetical protein